jgi:deoxyribodipyrimidine photo-lyase
MAGAHIGWFKRDLRVHDHAALAAAAERGRVLPLFIVEPALWHQPDYAGRHWAFAAECLAELRVQLTALGQPLVVRVVFDDFLTARGNAYNKVMSSPNTAFDGCSRLSPHLACGTLSMREVVQATRARRYQVRALPPERRGGWSAALAAFEGRLHWHCHFIQKLESEPSIEFENLHRACDGLRENDFDAERFEAWRAGHTGFPLVDACMRALQAGGWINFRMRAMLVSFSSYQVWLHWRQPARALARLFTDYEPGIHYSQVQMQSGTTGINTLRIYNPVKQSQDHDPEGAFIRRWVPELADVPTDWIHSP